MLGAAASREQQGGLFAVGAEELAGRRFGELAPVFAEAVPVGVIPRRDPSAIAYARDPDTRIDAADALVVTAESDAQARRLRAEPAAARPAGASPRSRSPPA